MSAPSLLDWKKETATPSFCARSLKLEEGDRYTQFLRSLLDSVLDLLEGQGAVHRRVPPAQSIEVGAADYHVGHDSSSSLAARG